MQEDSSDNGVRKIVGSKQVARAVESAQAQVVYLAQDADEFVRTRILTLCEAHDVPVEWAQSMQQLGRDHGIHVGAATAALLKSGE